MKIKIFDGYNINVDGRNYVAVVNYDPIAGKNTIVLITEESLDDYKRGIPYSSASAQKKLDEAKSVFFSAKREVISKGGCVTLEVDKSKIKNLRQKKVKAVGTANVEKKTVSKKRERNPGGFPERAGGCRLIYSSSNAGFYLNREKGGVDVVFAGEILKSRTAELEVVA